MTKQEEKDLKKIVVEAIASTGGRNAIVDAMHSIGGQEAIKSGALQAMMSQEGKTVFSEQMTEWYRGALEPTLEDMWDDIRQVKTAVRHIRERYDIKFERLERKVGIDSSL